MDEDEAFEALRAVYGSGTGRSNPAQAEAEAKVRFQPYRSRGFFRAQFCAFWAISEYQVRQMQKCVQEYRVRELPRGKERPRPVRGIS